MSTQLTQAEIKTLEDASWNGGRTAWIAAIEGIITERIAQARREGAAETLEDAADDFIVGIPVGAKYVQGWLRDRAARLRALRGDDA